jgi:hypothetical protein
MVSGYSWDVPWLLILSLIISQAMLLNDGFQVKRLVNIEWALVKLLLMYGNVKAMEEQLSWSIEQAFSGSNPDIY